MDFCQVPVAHACNPSYSVGSWFEASHANSSWDPISKKRKKRNCKKRADGVAQGVGCEQKRKTFYLK
jgi:hypothetical protein